MRRIAALTILLPASTLLLVHCSAPAAASGPPSLSANRVEADASLAGTDTPAATRAEDQVRAADAAEVQAFLANDSASLARLWSDDFVVTNPFNQFLTKAQVLALVNNGVLAFSAYERLPQYVRIYGDVAIVAGSETVVWAGHIPLAGQTSHLRYTAAWARHGNTWQEIARHASIIAPGAPAGP